MEKIITIPEERTIEVQKADVERSARRDIIVYLMEHPEINVDENRRSEYQKEYDEKYFEASTQERQAAVLEHLDVVSAFYTKICDYLDEMLEKYEPQGFEYIAISAPS